MGWNATFWANISDERNESEPFPGDGDVVVDKGGLGGVEVVVIVVMSSIAVIGFQGNLSVAVVIINNPNLRTSMTNLFVLNLVIVDLLACVLALPLAVVAFSLRNSSQDLQICEVSGFLSTSFMLCSMLTLCVISMDRFYSIAMPLHHAAHSTPLIAMVVILTAWLVGILVACLPCIGLNSYQFKHRGRICSFEWAGDKNDRAFVITIFIISFLIPSLVILSMYSSIFCIARKAARTIAPQPSESTLTTIVNQEPDTNRGTNNNTQHPAVNSREIVVSTIGTSVERRPHVRVVSFSSDDVGLGHPFPSVNDCQRGVFISYSATPHDLTNNAELGVISDKTNAMRNISSSASGAVKSDDSGFPISSIQQKRQSITHLNSTNSRLMNCDQEYCKQHPNDKNSGKFCCHCTTQIDSQTRETHIPETEKPLQSPNTIPTITNASQNISSLGTTMTSSSIPQETMNPKLQIAGPQSSTRLRPQSQPTPSVTTATPPTNRPPPVTSRPKHNKAFRTVMVIVLSYLLLWGPYFMCQVYQSRGGSVPPSCQLLVSWLGFTSYTVHPFLYGGMNRLIRDELSHLYKTIFAWIKALAFCLCWSCCRCCTCCHVTKDFFTPTGDDRNNNSSAALYCLPWLRAEEEEGEEEDGNNGNEISEMPGGGRRRRKIGGDDDIEGNEDDRTESFFQFLQRTQEEDSHVPESLVMETGSTIG